MVHASLHHILAWLALKNLNVYKYNLHYGIPFLIIILTLF